MKRIFSLSTALHGATSCRINVVGAGLRPGGMTSECSDISRWLSLDENTLHIKNYKLVSKTDFPTAAILKPGLLTNRIV